MTEPLPSRFPGIAFAAIAAELAREVEYRRAVYPGQISKGRMTRPEAEWQIALFNAILADCRRFERAWQTLPLTREKIGQPAHSFSWQNRRAALRRELEMRQRVYPGQISKGRMTPADAQRRTTLLRAMLALYEDGADFPGTREDFHPIYQELLDERRQQLETDQTELAL